MSDFYGPALPPGFAGAQSEEDTPTEQKPSSFCGPQLPSRGECEEDSTTGGVYGPALPPGLATGSETLGPQVPSDRDVTEPPQHHQQQQSGSDEEDVVGPLPVSQEYKEELERERRRADVESRAGKMMDHLTGAHLRTRSLVPWDIIKDKKESEGPKREEWMTQLPPEVKAFGLGPRKFRTRDVELGDRTVWTDTPADRLRKQQECAEGKMRKGKKDAAPSYVSERDEKLADKVEQYNKACRSESLMEMHRKRRAEQSEESKGVRRPFDREVDLKLPQNIVTPAKRQALMKDSASSLKNKFSHGSQRFL